MSAQLAADRVWTEKSVANEAEKKYFESFSKHYNANVVSTIELVAAKPEVVEEETSVVVAAASESPAKKLKNKKKAKKEAAAAAAAAATLATTLVVASEPVPTPTVENAKTKAKKEKNNKLKKAGGSVSPPMDPCDKTIAGNNANNINNNSVAAEETSFSVVHATPDETPAPTGKPKSAAAIQSAKDKKQRKRDKKAAAAGKEVCIIEVDAATSSSNGETTVETVAVELEIAVTTSPSCPVAEFVVVGVSKKDKKSKKKQQLQLQSTVAPSTPAVQVVVDVDEPQQIEDAEQMNGIAALASTPGNILERLTQLEKDNASLRDVVEQLKKASLQSEDRIKQLESRLQSLAVGAPAASAAPAVAAAAAPVAAASKASDDDDGVDLFGSDSEEEDDEAAKLREKRLAEYANKKSNKPTLIAKSNIILDIKPWDDETDMKAMEAEVRKIVQDGLLWGAAKLVPIAYGILKLQISCVVEDDKVSIDALSEQLESIEDFVQSVDVAAFNKI